MKRKNISAVGTICLAAVWTALTIACWFAPEKTQSETERRPLEQKPQISAEAVMNGSFTEKFSSYSLDQFPMRDSFRQARSLFHYYGLGQRDIHGIYLADGYAVKQEYPMNADSVDYAMKRFNHLYRKYLNNSDTKIYMAVVPDKGYYFAQSSGQLSMDYEALFETVRQEMPWATHIPLTDVLQKSDYYRTDTHWKQENLFGAAGRICQNMGVTAPRTEDFTATALEKPFYGVYYGQAALPMEPDTLYLMESEFLSDCRVYDYESEQYIGIYDFDTASRDLYDTFLSGPRSLLTVENPHGKSGKSLVVFRDSFGSSLAPLILQDYETVTLVDIRYINIDLLDRFLEFENQDVLFLYSTLVLNNSSTIK